MTQSISPSTNNLTKKPSQRRDLNQQSAVADVTQQRSLSNLSHKRLQKSTTTTVVGKGQSSKLSAAGPRVPVEKSVYYVSNLSNNCSINDILAFCRT